MAGLDLIVSGKRKIPGVPEGIALRWVLRDGPGLGYGRRIGQWGALASLLLAALVAGGCGGDASPMDPTDPVDPGPALPPAGQTFVSGGVVTLNAVELSEDTWVQRPVARVPGFGASTRMDGSR